MIKYNKNFIKINEDAKKLFDIINNEIKKENEGKKSKTLLSSRAKPGKNSPRAKPKKLKNMKKM